MRLQKCFQIPSMLKVHYIASPSGIAQPKQRWRGTVMETEVKREWTDGHLIAGESSGLVKVCSPVDVTIFLLDQTVTKPAYLLI